MFGMKLLILAIVGAVIGWSTNILAIKLIFRPLNSIRIPIIGIEVQGLIPKRKKEIAKSIGEIVETELISIREIIDKMVTKGNREDLISNLKIRVESVLEKKLPVFIPSTFKDMIGEYVNEIIDKEGNKAIDEIIDKMTTRAVENIKVAEMVEEKINEFPLEKLEEIILSIAKKELKHIEVLGAVLGCAIGFVQGIIINLI
ncbi:DUF445 family protein [Lutibacter sp. B2]|nr:DUF445 family protein [Lutibacter sp. B2]